MLFSAAFIQPEPPPLNAAAAAQLLARLRPDAGGPAGSSRATPPLAPAEEVPPDLDQRVRLSGEW